MYPTESCPIFNTFVCMSTTSLPKVKAIPEVVKRVSKELDEFILWHKKQHYELSGIDLPEEKQQAYLDKILFTKNWEYHQMIEELGEKTAQYTPDELGLVFHYLVDNGLQRLLMDAPYWYHSIFKPRGYAGDAEMMALIYRDEYEGPDLFSKLMHRIGLDCAACVSIRNRKNLLLDSFKEFAGGKVLSLAAGPAKEIEEYLEVYHDIDFLALDHDIETLKNAKKKYVDIPYGIINAFHLIKGHSQYLIPRPQLLESCNPKKDLKGLRRLFLPFKYQVKKLKSESFDMVYSAGLYDYIETFEDRKDKGSIALTRKLFDLVKPGGRMIIGNMNQEMPVGVRWVMEAICDWYLIYRDKEEVLAFASEIPESQIESIEIIQEERGLNYFLDIRKKR